MAKSRNRIYGEGGRVNAGTKDTSSGTEHDWTGLPDWITRIVLTFNRCSLSGTDHYLVQIGDAIGGLKTTDYLSSGGYVNNGARGNTVATNGFAVRAGAANESTSVVMIFEKGPGDQWIQGHSGTNDVSSLMGGGDVTLSGPIDRVRLTRTGTNNFDGGTATLTYE